MPDDNVELIARWSESGADVPRRVRQSLLDLRPSAEQSLPSFDRLGQAFTRLEQREPTMVMRRVRFAVEEMAMSSIGATGPLGRMAASVGIFAGGTIGIGVAAVGFEVKKLAGYADELDKNLKSVNDEFAKMVPGAARINALGTLRTRAGELADTSVGARAFSTSPEFMFNSRATGVIGALPFIGPSLASSLGDLAAAAQAARMSQLATVLNEIAQAQHEADRQREQAEVDRNRLIERTGLQQQVSLDRARLALQPQDTATQLHMVSLNEALQLLGIRTLNVDDKTKQLMSTRINEIAVLERLKILEDARNRTIDEAHRLASFQNVYFDPNDIYARARAANQGPPPLEPWMTGNPAVDARIKESMDRRDATLQNLNRYDPRAGTQASEADRQGERIGTIIAAHIVPFVAAMAGQGGAGAAVSVAGSALTSLSTIQKFSKGTQAELGTIGIVASIAGGLISLFGQHKPRVVITAFEEEARRQIQELRGEPLTTQIIVVGNDPRRTQYDLGRLQRRDSVTRLP